MFCFGDNTIDRVLLVGGPMCGDGECLGYCEVSTNIKETMMSLTVSVAAKTY
jgi:hypothetical protein